ncbi:hypothetical protein GCM10027403_01030 [Arthrobacter tecti]
MLTGLFLCHGVSWATSGPILELTTPQGTPKSLSLAEPQFVGFRVDGPPGQRYCTGYAQAIGPTERNALPCPTQTTAERGYQCGPCFARDDFRFMHDVHRSGIAPPGLAAYLAQDHWLYIATFADGSTKVGTASNRSKWTRLAEQGAVVARFVAHTEGGRVVRVLEDTVTRHLGLPQGVRSAVKVAGLARPMPTDKLDAVNGENSALARELLRQDIDIDGFHGVDERWDPPASWRPVLAARAQVYAPSPEAGEHGGEVRFLLGQVALVDLPEGSFLLDLSRLRGRRLELGSFRSPPIAVQDELF